jgi:hypothetical protein
MGYKIHNAVAELLIEDTTARTLTYYLKSELSVSAIAGNVVISRTVNNNTNQIFNYPPADIDLPVFNGLYDLVITIHSYITSGTSSSDTDIKRASYVLTTAQVLALNSTPITIVSGVADKELQVMSAAVRVKFASAAYATNTTLAIGTTSDPDGQAQLNCLAAATTIRGTMGLVTTGVASNLHTGEDLVISAVSGNPTAGNSDVVVDITYREIDL